MCCCLLFAVVGWLLFVVVFDVASSVRVAHCWCVLFVVDVFFVSRLSLLLCVCALLIGIRRSLFVVRYRCLLFFAVVWWLLLYAMFLVLCSLSFVLIVLDRCWLCVVVVRCCCSSCVVVGCVYSLFRLCVALLISVVVGSVSRLLVFVV